MGEPRERHFYLDGFLALGKFIVGKLQKNCNILLDIELYLIIVSLKCRRNANKENKMIITFSVQNFRSIRNKVTLDFRATSDKTLEDYYVVSVEKPKLRILRMAMIYGANASGKTNLLMALDFLKDFIGGITIVLENYYKKYKVVIYNLYKKSKTFFIFF